MGNRQPVNSASKTVAGAGSPPQPDPKAFVKLLGAVVAAVGGITALLMLLGYIIVQSYIASMQLYGLADFPVQFYKEATISFLGDIMRFYAMKPYVLAVSISIIALPLLYCVGPTKKQLTHPVFKKGKGIFAAAAVFVVIVLALKLGAFQEGLWGMSGRSAENLREAILYTVALPSLLACLLYLIFAYRGFELSILTKSVYGVVLLFFVLLLASIPIGYGSAMFDVSVYRVRSVALETPLEAFKTSPGGEFRVYYMMGHTSDRELFFDATTMPASPVLVAKNLIQAIEISGNTSQPMYLRSLFKTPSNQTAATPAAKPLSGKDAEWERYVR